MKTPVEMSSYLAYRVGLIYYHRRPLMYGGTADGVDLLLHTYHEIWAVLAERVEAVQEIERAVCFEEDCGSASFSTRFAMTHPEASQVEIASYVVEQWKKVSDRAGLPIPHELLKAEFPAHIG